jgi:hypothetical protein
LRTSFSNGLARVRIGHKYGFVNTQGEVVIKADFLAAENFEDGLCYVETANTVGYINSSGEYVWQGRYVDSRRGSMR